MLVQSMPYPVVQGSGGDPNFASVVLLTDYGDTNGGTSFTDLSNSNHVLTPSNGPTASTSVMLGGRPSLALNGSNQRISIPDSEDWFMGTAAFTMECFFQTNSTAKQTLFSQYIGNPAFRHNLNDSNAFKSFFNTEGGSGSTPQGGTLPVSQSPHHFAVVREKLGFSATQDAIRLYFDGALLNTAAIPTEGSTGTIRNSTGALFLGYGDQFNPLWFNGNLGPVRITKGVCRYPGGTNFTPPTGFATS